MKKNIFLKLIIIVSINLISISQIVQSQTLSGRVYEGTTGIEPPASKPIFGVTINLYGSNDANLIGTFVISTTTTDSAGWYGLPVRGAFDFYNIVEENPAGYNSDGATSVSGTVKSADWIQYTYDQLSQTTTGNKFWDKKPGPLNNPPIADANGPYTGIANQPVQFDGSGSFDPDSGDWITSYEWDMNNDGQFDDATGVYPTWTWNSPTTQIIHLMVTDTHGAYGTDSTYVTIEAQLEYDYGDAPDPSYPTLRASNGARHQIDPDVFLGTKIDADEDGLQSSDAMGDDNGNIDDEDGIVFKSAFIPGNWTPFEATVSVNGYLGVWVDFNGNGSWADPGESLFHNDTSVYNGVNNWSIFVPANAKLGNTFARFRFSTIHGLTFDGSWQDGEVEDYLVEIAQGNQFGSITIIKSATPPDSGVIFNFTGDLGNFILTPTSNSRTFSNLTPGIYNLAENIPPGWYLGNYQIAGDLDGGTTHDSLAATWAIDLDAGEDITLVIYNYKPGEESASVGDWVWHDLNQNGLQDTGEPGLDSVQVSLFDQNGNLLAMTTTNVTGFYLFSNITPGSYFINFSLRSGFAYSPPDQGMDDTIDSDAQYGTGNTPLFTLLTGEHKTNVDAGMYRGEGSDELDFGDAPDPNYPTLLTSNGARHVIRPGFYLGFAIDPEPNGFPTPLSDGDNTHDINDEDGVTMSPLIAPGQSVPITVIASDSGVLNAWIDFNRNGDWADVGDHFIPAMPVHPGSNSFTMTVPAIAQFGNTYARFRLSSIRQLSYDGLAPDGEVEDYAVEIVEGDDGSITIIKDANPKDNTPFMMCTHFTSGFFNILCVNLRDPLMNMWTILNPYQVISVTETFVPGWTLTDITVTGDSDNGSTINLASGRVDVDYDPGENIAIVFKNEKTGGDEFDFGDAPDPNYPTLLANNGARHIIKPNFYLGSAIDAEPDGLPALNADGDNLNILNDEDGVTMLPFIVPGQAISITVVASDSGVLNAWLDFNINGSWADAGEHFIAAQPVFPGANSFALNVPPNAVIGKSYARFRLSSVRNISYDGIAPDGEVEDYAVNIIEGGGGSLTIIKDAMPKDNTPFWITTIYGAMGGAAPFRDPLSNSATISNGPAGTYHLGESVPAGWKLMDIIVTGDVDNGSVVNLTTAGAHIDLDNGENITVTFKNEKTSGRQFDFGDAPDNTNHHGVGMEAYAGISARFPTVFDPATGLPSGPIHRNPLGDAWLGSSFSLEQDADIMPDDDGLTNIDPPNNAADRDRRDDGVIFPIVLLAGQPTCFTYLVSIPVGSAGLNRYVNVWLDWNRDGDWGDVFTVHNPNDAPEWAVQNQLITAGFPSGNHLFATPMFMVYQPANAENKPIWMRISIAEQPAPQPADGRGPAAGYELGETEDYYFFADDTTTGKLYDFGDAPDNPNSPGYPTLHANGGAYHHIIDGFHLGGLIDGEPNGLPAPDALGDDNVNIDDEDGVSFSTPLIPGQQAIVEVVASANGILNAWIDYNANSSWLESDEHVLIDRSISAGNNPLSFNVPATAVPGITFARFRLSRIPGVMSTGYGLAGEVEDYEVGIERGGEEPPIKWRQIPLVNENPDMLYTPYFFGWDVTSVYDGTYVADDWFCKSPRPVTEIHWWGSYTDWDSVFPPLVAPYAFHIGVWTDVPKGVDTDWSHPGEMIWEWMIPREMAHERMVGNDFHPEYMSKPDTCFRYEFVIPHDQWFHQEGDSTIYWLSISALYEEQPDSFVWGWKTREHFFHDDAVYVYDPVTPTIGAVATNTEPIDEGWDLAFVLKTNEYFLEYDFGDAPFERYPTFFGQNGAHHIYDPDVFLGQHIDTEINGQPDPTCTGDDNDRLNDDDGIKFLNLTTDGIIEVEVTASRSGYLNAWMDFDNNGSWAEPEDQIFQDEFIPGGQSILTAQIPDGAVPPPIFSRFRFSTEPGLSYIGIAIDGEVEDYLFDFIPLDVGQKEKSIIPTEFRLYQNYPNPFNSETIICFDLPTKKHKPYQVNISIYNIKGQLIRTLMDEEKSPGAFAVKWDGQNNSGQKVNSGIYLLKIIADDYTSYRKMIILK